MNFKDWEKISEDEKTCTLRHPKGHTMMIAMKALPKIQQDQIRMLKMAGGGRVSDREIKRQREERDNAELGPTGTTENFSPVGKNTPIGKMTRERDLRDYRNSPGPKLKGLAEGGKVESQKEWPHGEGLAREVNETTRQKREEFLRSPEGSSLLDAANAVSERIRNAPSSPPPKRKNYDGGTPDGTVSSDDSASDASAQPQNSNGDHTTNVYVTAPQAQPQAPAQPMQMQAPSQETPANPPPIQQPAPGPITAQGGLRTQAGNTLQGINAGQQAIQTQQAIDTAKAQAEVPAQEEYIKSQQQIAQENAAAYNDISKHSDDFKNYMTQNPIDPNHYMESRTSGTKVANAIGLFLGGLGTPFGGHNYAMDFLNKQIDRDIDAQKSRSEQAKTIYGAYQHLYGDSNVATNLATATSKDILANKIQLASQQLGTPQALANAQAATAKLSAESNELRQGAAAIVGNNYRAGKMGGTSGGQTPQAPAGSKGNPPTQQQGTQNEHILVPGSSGELPLVAKNPLMAPMMGAIIEQHAKADLADKAIDTINQYFPQTAATAQTGAGYLHRKAKSLENAPLIGPEIAAAGNTIFDTQNSRDYDRAYSAIVGAVRGALQGNVGEDLLDKTVKANTPELDDTPEMVKKKMATLKEFIRSHTKTDLLRSAGLSKK